MTLQEQAGNLREQDKRRNIPYVESGDIKKFQAFVEALFVEASKKEEATKQEPTLEKIPVEQT